MVHIDEIHDWSHKIATGTTAPCHNSIEKKAKKYIECCVIFCDALSTALTMLKYTMFM